MRAAFLGYLEAYPDYWTQGESIDELKANLIDIYNELTGGAIPCVRRVAELLDRYHEKTRLDKRTKGDGLRIYTSWIKA